MVLINYSIETEESKENLNRRQQRNEGERPGRSALQSQIASVGRSSLGLESFRCRRKKRRDALISVSELFMAERSGPAQQGEARL